MKMIALLALFSALLFVAPTALVADDEDPPKNEGGGSKFGDETEETEEKPSEPKPRTITFKDYRLEMETKDGRWWKRHEIPAAEVEKGVCLNESFKRPKSENAFDIRIFCQGWKHGGKLEFPDGTKIGTDNYKALAEKYYKLNLKDWKEVRNPKKPKAAKISRTIRKAYRYSLTGLLPAWGNFPLHREAYFFKWKDKTYRMEITYTTGSFREKRVTDEVNALLGTLRERKERRRR